MQRALDQQRHRIGLIAQRLHDLSPLQILDRGYALVSEANGHIVRDARTLQKGQQVTLRLQQGQAIAQILSIQPNMPIVSTSSDEEASSPLRKRPSRHATQSQLPLPIFPPKDEK